MVLIYNFDKIFVITKLLAGTLALVLVSGFGMPAFANPIEQITNGDFESGTFSGWTVSNTGSGNWNINDGTFVSQSPLGLTPPISGGFDALTDQGGPGTHMLSEPFVVPSGVVSANVNWNDRIFNWAGVFMDPNQEVRVEIRDSTGANVLATIFSTNPGDTLLQAGPNIRSFDITSIMQSLEGQTVRLCFEEEDDMFFFNYIIDDVSLTIDTMLVGGESLPIDSTALILAAAQSPAAWLTALTIAALGISAYVFTRNPSNMRNIKVILRDYLDRF